MSLATWPKLIVGVATLFLVGCTVVDLDENGKPIMPVDPNAKASFANQTPQQIAQDTWQSRVQQAATQQGLDAGELGDKLSQPSAPSQSFFVRLTGPIEQVVVKNEREKSLVMDLNGSVINIQLGPVVRGNAIRDASGFKFDDFTNQVQYAQLARAYNREAIKHLPDVDASWQGKNATALIAVTVNNGKLDEAVAISLKEASNE